MLEYDRTRIECAGRLETTPLALGILVRHRIASKCCRLLIPQIPLAATREAAHGYSLEVSADVHSLNLTRVLATPRIRLFRECPSAVENTNRLIGVPLRELRAAVLEHLLKTFGLHRYA